jgi:hypothetical protein
MLQKMSREIMLKFSIRNVKAVLSIAVLLLGIICIEGCGNRQISISQSEQPIDILKGVSLSPLSFQSRNFTDFFEKAEKAGNIVSWAGDCNEINNPNNGPKVIVELAATYNYTPLIELQFFTQSTGALLKPLDEATKQSYKNDVVDFVDKYKLKYLGIAIEVNTLYAKSPSGFDAFVKFYNEIYDAVKVKSPDTKVFTIFQLEMMKGLNGGLFGGTNDASKEQWLLLDRFPKSDVIAFTEIGWHSEAGPSGWESSDSEQAEFINKFWDLSRSLEKELAIWSFMYDQDTVVPFKSMGLYRRDCTPKPAWNEWLNSEKN